MKESSFPRIYARRQLQALVRPLAEPEERPRFAADTSD
jgi:hypothetical protein